MKLPKIEDVHLYLSEAKLNNKGPWDQHSLLVGEAARLIASRCDHLDEELAFVMGALHDIGRREGFSHMHHTISGYNYMTSEGYDQIAKICLTHSFPNRDLKEYFGEKDCSTEEIDFIINFLSTTTYDDYDRLIQLCDTIASASGYCLMEKRMIDVALRYGATEYSQKKWQTTFEIQAYFEEIIGISVYKILPNVKEHTFGF